ncbi:MAG TPA: HAMP domain-containing sensor histidine kinase [Planktothrix sp.]|jgi:signal transduction histidine kinase
MRLNLTLSQKAIILVAVPLAFELAFVSVLDSLRLQVEQEEKQQVHARDIYRHVDRLLRNVMDRAQESIVFSICKSLGVEDKAAEHRIEELAKNTNEEAAAVRKFTASDPGERRSFAACESLQAELSLAWKNTAIAMNDGDRLAALREFKRGRVLGHKLFDQCDRISAIEHDVEAKELDAEVKHRDQTDLLIKCAVVFNVLLAVALAAYFNVGTTRRLNILMGNIVRLAGNEKLQAPLQGQDEIARLDRTFHEMADAKHEMEEMKQEFITMISHDLRSPLTSVQTFLDLLETGICGELNEKGKTKLQSADRNVQRLLDLIRDLLDLERFESGIIIVDKTEVDVRAVVDRSVDAVKLQAEQLGIEIETSVPDVKIFADQGRLSQVLVNLLSNALKFSPSGSKVTITGRPELTWLELRIKDQGRGISEEDQARIFERFHQVKEEDADIKRGTGLGLPICQAIIEQHGGTISVESEKGKGSTFLLRLPSGSTAPTVAPAG